MPDVTVELQMIYMYKVDSDQLCISRQCRCRYAGSLGPTVKSIISLNADYI